MFGEGQRPFPIINNQEPPIKDAEVTAGEQAIKAIHDSGLTLDERRDLGAKASEAYTARAIQVDSISHPKTPLQQLWGWANNLVGNNQTASEKHTGTGFPPPKTP